MADERTFRKATIREVAARAGVSATTVSHVVSGNRTYSDDTVRRVRLAIEELSYVPSYTALGLRQRSTMTIGVCAQDPYHPEAGRQWFCEQLFRGIMQQADEDNYSVLVFPRAIRENRSTDAFLNGLIDGLLVTLAPDDPRPEQVARVGLPVVVQARSFDLPTGVGAVAADEAAVACLALDHLWDLGHRRIAHIAGPVGTRSGATPTERDDVAVGRWQGYIAWCKARGVYDPSLVGFMPDWEPTSIDDVVAHWYEMPNRPTAVFCANDPIAVAFMEFARLSNWRVPGHVSVIGVDDAPVAKSIHPPLTSVWVPVDEIGRESVRCLLRLIRGESAENCRSVIAPLGLEIRDSTAVPPPA